MNRSYPTCVKRYCFKCVNFLETWLHVAFAPVAIEAQQLAVIGASLAAPAPRGDVVSFHFIELKMTAALRADAVLPFVGFALLAFGERADVEVSLGAGEHEGVNAFLVGHVVVHHQGGDFLLQLGGIKHIILESIVQTAPIDAFHLAAVGGEGELHPLDDVPEVGPQFVGVGVVLMRGHVALDVAFVDPLQRGFEDLLADGRAVDVVLGEQVSCAVALAEFQLGVSQPRTGVHGVAQFLVEEFLTGDVDDAEPIELLFVVALAKVDHQFVIQDLFALDVGEVVKGAVVDGEVAVDVLAKTDGALLTVHDLEVVFGVLDPVHHVERKALADGIEHGVALGDIVDELALVGRADVEPAAETDHALFGVIDVALRHLADGDLVQFDVHFPVPFRLMIIRA